jgi:hypothetical protein
MAQDFSMDKIQARIQPAFSQELQMTEKSGPLPVEYFQNAPNPYIAAADIADRPVARGGLSQQSHR